MNLVSDYNELMQFLSFEQVSQLKENFHNCTEILDKKLYELSTKEGKNFSYEEDKLKGKLPLEEHRNYMDKIFHYHLINKKLVIDDNKEKIKKPKL